MFNPRVSVIVPTRNSAAFLEACLSSIKNQTYPHLELIVVDRDSTDETKVIAKRYTDMVFNHGPERSAQRNFGVSKATGEYVLIIDSDMELSDSVIDECIMRVQAKSTVAGVVIPEHSFGEGFWAQCKSLEKSFYEGYPPVEAARFMSRENFLKLGGFDEALVAGEDWDLSSRLRRLGSIVRIKAPIRHNEGRVSLIGTLRKKYYYAQSARAYLGKSSESSVNSPAGPIQRYRLFFSRPAKLFRNPVYGLGMLFMKTSEFAIGAIGYIFYPKGGMRR